MIVLLVLMTFKTN